MFVDLVININQFNTSNIMCRVFSVLIDAKDKDTVTKFISSFLKKINRKLKLKIHIVQTTKWANNSGSQYKELSSSIDWIDKEKYYNLFEKQRKHIGKVYGKIFNFHEGSVYVYETNPPYEQRSACGCEIAYFPNWSNKHPTLQPGWRLIPYHLESEVILFLKKLYPLCHTVRFFYAYTNSFLEPEYGMN